MLHLKKALCPFRSVAFDISLSSHGLPFFSLLIHHDRLSLYLGELLYSG